ncbi:leukocyte immunoglobulin-like receptor subfamily B member 4 isoform X2 [Nannospalax galili]|uniref:leukocyte immunoglobulin-like receptor subfamily B member 4 isoform X2 n=1 Tax=Nannospalax galili TaxID=1026970 RepID=UPI00111C1155|nr:leukocyte immunoglobulin-like receptor subfamily B member 4 isoform X2 [Nannospalax galili]
MQEGEDLSGYRDKALRGISLPGLGLSIRTAALTGTLPKPIIWPEPSSVIAKNMPVTIWCQGTFESLEYQLHKEGSQIPWDRQYPLLIKNKAKFSTQFMTMDYAGRYHCRYSSPAGWSELSDPLELVMTGVYQNPSLSVLPSHVVTLGVSITFQCWSELGFGTFMLIREGKPSLSFTLDSQHHN